MIVELPEVQELSQKLDCLCSRISKLETKLEVQKQWFTLPEACRVKGVPYGSVCSRPRFQPNKGKPDGIVAGRRRWKLESILEWIEQTDVELLDVPERQ